MATQNTTRGGKWVQKQMCSEHRDRVYWGLKFALMACQKLMGSVHEENLCCPKKNET